MKHMWSEEEIASQKKDISTLVDSKGNPRFVEGKGTPATITGLTFTYCKWSLSGTHLMLVLAGTISNTTALTPNTTACSFTIPNFIHNKIVPTVGTTIEYKQITAYASDYSGQNIVFRDHKESNNKLTIVFGNTVTINANRNFRVQFDLLIDAE